MLQTRNVRGRCNLLGSWLPLGRSVLASGVWGPRSLFIRLSSSTPSLAFLILTANHIHVSSDGYCHVAYRGGHVRTETLEEPQVREGTWQRRKVDIFEESRPPYPGVYEKTHSFV